MADEVPSVGPDPPGDGALPAGTVTFLFTDIAGSTRLLRQDRQAYGAALAEHRRLLRAAFAACGGREVDTQGDSFFVAFPTLPSARAGCGRLRLAREAIPAQSLTCAFAPPAWPTERLLVAGSRTAAHDAVDALSRISAVIRAG